MNESDLQPPEGAPSTDASAPRSGPRFLRLLLAAVALALLAAVATTGFVYLRLNEAYKGYAGSEAFLDIPPGTSVTQIGRALADAGVVRDSATFRAAARLTNAQTLQAGEYRFDRPLTPFQVVDKLARGDVYLRAITFREGLNIREMAALYEEKGFGKAGAFIKAASQKEQVADIDPQATDLEGYLFPDTYRVRRGTTEDELVRAMVKRFRDSFGPDLRKEVEASGRPLRAIVTLASIVEKETGKADERPLTSAVYHNRLRVGMPLQCDPTVIYALQQANRYTGNITRADLAFDSPYNTYRYPGLPPGPIASPGKASLEAAVRPAKVDYLYFVSRNDGSHVFARTLEEHNRNVHQYQILYFREKRLEEQRRKQAEDGQRP